MAEKKSKRIKNPHPQPKGPELLKERIKAGSPGSPVALPGDPEAREENTKKKKVAPK